MPSLETARTDRAPVPRTGDVVNDFSIQVATVNGSGSQTANLVLIRSIFHMGIPVSGKNLFPSNIAGLPTWYTIRANRHGYVGRKKEIDVLVAMNPESAQEDVRALAPGAAVVYDEPLQLSSLRDDLVFYPVPFDKLLAGIATEAKLRRLVKNMVYDGVLSSLFGIELDEMTHALRKQLAKKPKALAMNQAALEAGAAFAGANFEKRDPFRVERMDATAGKILIEGNAAAALGCLMAGVTVVGWYPITPSSSLCETLIDYLRRHRMDKATGKATFAVVQAEDEISALGMVIGAGWAGARAMTSTSGPGISLMSEFAGLGYYAEVPAVIVDVQRAGPSTGLPTRTMQGDIASTAWLSHGDTKHVLLLPCSVGECYSMAIEAFDLAEQLQTPVFVMMDLDLGMNTWMSDTFPYPDAPPVRGKRLTSETLGEFEDWGRYKDVDGDGIPYRTVPGDGLPAYFARGTGHNEHAVYSERPGDWVRNLDRLARKFETARRMVPPPDVERRPGAAVGIVAYGTTHWGAVESRDQLARDAGLDVSYLRLRAYPFTPQLEAFVRAHDRVYLVEQNRDAQMLSLIKAELDPALIPRLRSVLHYDGLPIDARSISDRILALERVDARSPDAPATAGAAGTADAVDDVSLPGSE
jgi:2-oxoglutarate ferredoxin oxidoreductase subunit alpha